MARNGVSLEKSLENNVLQTLRIYAVCYYSQTYWNYHSVNVLPVLDRESLIHYGSDKSYTNITICRTSINPRVLIRGNRIPVDCNVDVYGLKCIEKYSKERNIDKNDLLLILDDKTIVIIPSMPKRQDRIISYVLDWWEKRAAN